MCLLLFSELIRLREIFAIQVTYKCYFVGLLVCLQFNTLLEMFSTLGSNTCLWFCVSLLFFFKEYPVQQYPRNNECTVSHSKYTYAPSKGQLWLFLI